MTEVLQTRTEHSRSVDDAERYRALQTLTDLGLLIPLDAVASYHGRLREPGQEAGWAVDPSFANGSNDSGNYNVNARPTLYTGEKQVAEDFAKQRGLETIRSKYMSGLQDEVRGYTPEQRAEWLARLNREQKDQWDGFDPEYQARNPYEPYQPKTLDMYHVSDEARKLEKALTPEEKQARWKHVAEGHSWEVHEIVSPDTDAVVLDFDFDAAELGEADKAAYYKALKALIIPITEGSPVSFDARDDLDVFMEAVKDRVAPMYTEEDIPSIAEEAGLNEELVRQMCASFNTLQLVLMGPGYLAHKLIDSRAGIVTDRIVIKAGEEAQAVPLNLEYAEKFFREAHIVGASQPINSATLGKEITSISFFDLEKVNTKKHVKTERRATTRRLGAIASQFSSLEMTASGPSLVSLLRDVHVKPRKLVEAIKEGGIKRFLRPMPATGKVSPWRSMSKRFYATSMKILPTNYRSTCSRRCAWPYWRTILASPKRSLMARNTKKRNITLPRPLISSRRSACPVRPLILLVQS